MARESKPNFVFVFADDWGWGDLGCYGHPFVKTPNLDRMASEGILFSQFYVCSGVCSPSRAAAVTGLFPSRLAIHGHFANHQQNDARAMPDWLDPQLQTYMHLLRQSGYVIGHFGKWHLGSGLGAPEPFAYGIDECRVNAGNGPQLDFPSAYGSHRSMQGYHNGKEIPWPSKHIRWKSSQVIVDESLSFIERHQHRPFLVNVWLNDTHATLDPTPEQLEVYSDLFPEELQEKYVGAPAIYYAAVTDSDRHIGRLLDRLDQLGLRDNTVVIFSADNGPEDIVIRNASHSGVGSPGPFRGRKRSLYEGGIRTPFILRWPAGGARPDTVDDATSLCAVDLLPTFCQLAEVALPGGITLDGEDMSAAFRGTPVQRTKPLLWEWR
ncbi:MAG TPA: sulfatase-like hydrolase/transferase, partial [bacterium]|nr:sulfatase-like hydrolase/transferase [bacterium]